MPDSIQILEVTVNLSMAVFIISITIWIAIKMFKDVYHR